MIASIDISGHALYASYGKDIVCASVSSIVITTINAIVRLDQKAIDYSLNDGILISILNHNRIVDTLIDNMVSLLKDLQKQYEKNIIISEEVCSC